MNKRTGIAGALLSILLLFAPLSGTAGNHLSTDAQDMIKHFGNVNAPQEIDTPHGKKQYLPLQLAAGKNDKSALRMIRALVEAGADINRRGPNGNAALHTASLQGADQAIKLLVQLGANANLKNKDGETPLVTLIQWGSNVKAVTALLNAGASPNIADKKGETAIYKAAGMKPEDAVKILPLLIKHGGDLHKRNKQGATPLQASLSSPVSAAKPVVQLLLDAGANPDDQDAGGNTALHNLASQQTDKREQLIPLAESLIKAGAHINAKNKTGETPIYQSVFEDCYLGVTPAMSRYLLAHGADPDIKANDGNLARDLLNAPELHCPRQMQKLLAPSPAKANKTIKADQASSTQRLNEIMNAYASEVDKAGRAYQQAKGKAVNARGFSGLTTRQAVQSRQHLFAEYRDNTSTLIVLLKDARSQAWKLVQDNKVKAERKEVDAAVVRSFGQRMSKDGLESLKIQFYWADAYYNVFTLLDQHWGKWRADERKHVLNATDKVVQRKLNREMKMIREFEGYMK